MRLMKCWYGVASGLVCQSDIKRSVIPSMNHRIFGHETSGVIAAVGNEVTRWEVDNEL